MFTLLLIVVNIYLGVSIYSLYRSQNYIDEKLLTTAVEKLTANGIMLQDGAIPLRKQKGYIYVGELDNYNYEIVAKSCQDLTPWKILLFLMATPIRWKTGMF